MNFRIFFVYLPPTLIATKGLRVCFLLEKDVYETLSSVCESRKFKSTRRYATERPLRVYCTLYASTMRRCVHVLQYRTAWAISSCLSLYEAMREPTHGISEEVEHPRLYVSSYFMPNRGGYRRNKLRLWQTKKRKCVL